MVLFTTDFELHQNIYFVIQTLRFIIMKLFLFFRLKSENGKKLGLISKS